MFVEVVEIFLIESGMAIPSSNAEVYFLDLITKMRLFLG